MFHQPNPTVGLSRFTCPENAPPSTVYPLQSRCTTSHGETKVQGPLENPGQIAGWKELLPRKKQQKKRFHAFGKAPKKNDNLKQTLSIFKGRKNCKPIIGSASWGPVFLRRRSGIFKEDLNIGFFVILQHDTSKQFVMQKQTT